MPKGVLIDMTGRQCGLWTVLERAPQNVGRGEASWWCVCDCGYRAAVPGGELRRNRSRGCRSCVVRRDSAAKRAAQDPAKLALRRAEVWERIRRQKLAVNERKRLADRAKAIADGTYREPTKMVDLTGMRLGRWTVLQRVESKHQQTWWLCRCSCGLEKTVQGASLRHGKSTQCRLCAAASMRTTGRQDRLADAAE